MTKKHFIELADMIVRHNKSNDVRFEEQHISALADFCRSQNYNFKGERWVRYIKGECGPNGGEVKK